MASLIHSKLLFFHRSSKPAGQTPQAFFAAKLFLSETWFQDMITRVGLLGMRIKFVGVDRVSRHSAKHPQAFNNLVGKGAKASDPIERFCSLGSMKKCAATCLASLQIRPLTCINKYSKRFWFNIRSTSLAADHIADKTILSDPSKIRCSACREQTQISVGEITLWRKKAKPGAL